MHRRALFRAGGTAIATATGLAGAQTTTAQEATVSLSETNAPVQGTEWLSVSAFVSNQRSVTTVSGNVQLVVGHDPDTVDSQYVSLAPNETRSVTLGYRTWGTPRTQTFPAQVFFEGASDSVMVTVTPAP